MLKGLGDKKRWVGLLLFAFLAVAVGVLVQTGSATEKVGPEIGNKTPDFTLDSLTTKNVKLYQVIKENKVTLINFWGI